MLAASPRTTAFVLASLIALALVVDLLWMPVQVYDALPEILEARETPSAWAAFNSFLRQSHYLRPLRAAQIKALFDLAGGEHYWLVYRGFHALLIVAAVLLFTAAQRVATRADLAASAFALVVLIGLRTFRGTVQEAFPINHFLEVVVLCLLTLTLARSRGGWWADVSALFAFGVAALTIESGMLVWVVAVAAWAVGWRGISTRGVAAMTVLVAGYVYLRVVHLSTGLPDLSETSSGFLFGVLEGAELQERFGGRLAWFYAYNVAASALSVLFSEPSSGIFVAAREWLSGDLRPRMVIAVVTSMATTLLLVWAAARCLRGTRQLDDTARFLMLLGVVLAANSAVSFAYPKDEIMGVAGAFYALAAFAVMRTVFSRLDGLPRGATVAILLLAAVLTWGWSVRAAGVHYLLRTQAFRQQNDWVQLPGRWPREGRWPDDPAARALIGRLYSEAVGVELPNTRLGKPRWVERVWED